MPKLVLYLKGNVFVKGHLFFLKIRYCYILKQGGGFVKGHCCFFLKKDIVFTVVIL